MPGTRAREAVPNVEVEGGEDIQASAREHGVMVGRGRARAKSRAGQERRDDKEALLDTDEQEDVGKTLHVKDGLLGFVITKGLFPPPTLLSIFNLRFQASNIPPKASLLDKLNVIKKNIYIVS